MLSNVKKIATPGDTTTTGPLDFTLIEKLFAENKVFRYGGSLTTTPCTEGVSWVISHGTLKVDPRTYTDLENVVRYNARYTQDGLNGVLPKVAVSSGPAGGGV